MVVAGCAPRLYETAFAEMMRAAGLNPGLLERVNLRGECAWVHQDDSRAATAQAQELVGMGVANVRLKQPQQPAIQSLAQRVLVIGGGLAGMTAALSLAEMEYPVDLVEQSGELGGQLRELRYTPAGDDPAEFLHSLVERVENCARLHVYREAQVQEVSGWVGQYQTLIALFNGGQVPLEHGAIIVATGGHEVEPTEYLYGQDPRVLTQSELGERLAGGGEVPSNVVMIQCVGSREPQRPYCSRICCTKAVVNALKIKEQNPEANVFILYREMRTYGFREDYYQEARDQGVIFLRYELPDKPQVSVDGEGVTICLRDPVMGEQVVLRAGMLVLSTGIDPSDNQTLADMLAVPLDENGFFQEEYPKTRPLDFARRGIFLCGLAHSPRFADETILQAQGAAMRAAALLAPKQLQAPTFTVQVNPRLCSACGQCVEVCPYNARVLEPGAAYAEVLEVLCQGCGACVAACPNKACQQKGLKVPQMYGMLDAVMQ